MKVIFSAIAIGLLAAACSSSSPSNDTSSTSAAKTCADLTKCCGGLTEPSKSACTAAVGGKNDSACASTYTQLCSGGDGGSAGATAGGTGGGTAGGTAGGSGGNGGGADAGVIDSKSEQANGACPGAGATSLTGTGAAGAACTAVGECAPTCCACPAGKTNTYLAAECNANKCANACADTLADADCSN